MNTRYLGIDFSGGALPWREGTRRPTVWVATARMRADGLRLDSLVPVQDLPGSGDAFGRLVSLLAQGDYAAAGIDAPFSLPEDHMPAGGHRNLVNRVGALPNASDRPFPRGQALVDLAAAIRPLVSAKPLRAVERHWQGRGVNTRSTLWNGPRGGAPFAVAALALIARSSRPCWPWSLTGPGRLAEVFPAAQLKTWGLPHQGYSAEAGRGVRGEIVEHLAERMTLPSGLRTLMAGSPDALDAVIALFGAAWADRTDENLPAAAEQEGWIAVHP